MDPAGPESDETRVVRGGSWNNDAIFARLPYRNDPLEPDMRDRFVGFRLARTVIVRLESTSPVAAHLHLHHLPPGRHAILGRARPLC
ncbi:MAG: SUMF1/EgtB/PvdO family nonheme iron enzyme [Candidatus Sericytochromatia bacterium]|nr:SUMF1/EgtB/PvdO family nonheme iron enzyme [Candidatus Tanganyikabacteria bacterium]